LSPHNYMQVLERGEAKSLYKAISYSVQNASISVIAQIQICVGLV